MKLKYFTVYLSLLFAASLLVSCNDILETNISKKTIALYAPKDGVQTNQTVTFWWQEVSGATKYRLQIVQTDSLFQDSLGLLVDTLVSKSQFTKTLAVGHYFWSVYGLNGGYNSLRSAVSKLTVKAGSISSNYTTIIHPTADTALNVNNYTLVWEPLNGAKTYTITIDFNGTDSTKSTTSTSYNYTFGKQGKYIFTITASRDSMTSLVSNPVALTFDTIAPDTGKSAFLNTPGSLSSTGNLPSKPLSTTTLSWSSATDSGSGILEYDLYLALAANSFSDKPTQSGGSQTYSLSNLSKLSPAPKTGDVYKWRVEVLDKAGNKTSTKTWYFKIAQ